jgi:hypothetical protein
MGTPLPWMLATLLAACGSPDRGSLGQGAEAPVRAFIDLGQSVYTIGGRTSDTVLLAPYLMQMSRSHLYVHDYGDHRLKAFDANTGAWVWSFGRAGSGPGEFRNPTQIALGSDAAEAWVVDGGNRRITVIREGTVVRELPLGALELLPRLVRLSDRTLTVLSSDADRLWAEFDSAGLAIDWGPFPLPGFSEADPHARQSLVAVSGDGEYWAVAFVYTHSFAVYRGTTLQCIGRAPAGAGIEQVVDPRSAPAWIAGVAFLESALLTAGRDLVNEGRHVIDIYDPADCRYRRSIRIPEPLRGFTGAGARFAVASQDPAPRITVYALPRIDRGRDP